MTDNPYSAASYSPSESTSAARVAPVGNRKLKTSTKTLSIILLVLGIFNVFSTLFALVFLFLGQAFLSIAATSDGNDEGLKRVSEQMGNALNPLSLSLLAFSSLLAIGLIVGSVGTLRRRMRGAQLLRWCTGLMAALTLCQSAYQIFMMPSTHNMMVQNMKESPNPPPEGFDTMMNFMFIAQIIFAVLFALLFFALYLGSFLHLSKESTLEQFETALEGGENRR